MKTEKSESLPEFLASKIKAVILDGDGVVFTSQVFFGTHGEVLKERSFIDGQGISLIRAAGIKVVLVTAEKSKFADVFVEKMNGLDSVKNGKWQPMEVITGVIGKDKVVAVEKWIEKHHLSWDECAYMGDDLGDYAVMEKVAFRACPNGAEKLIKEFSHFVAERDGGKGAIRDLCDFLLKAKGVDSLSLEFR